MANVLLTTVIVAALVVGGATLFALLHALVRARAVPSPSPSRALRDLEPRGGRHRFHARLFEGIVVAGVWLAALPLLWLWAEADDLPRAGNIVAGVTAGSLLTSTWWAWRRGSLRAPEADREDEVARD